MTGTLAPALLAAFVGLLAAAAVSDARTMRIPNRLSLLVVAAFLPFAPLAGLGLVEVGLHLGTGVGVLALTFALFAMGLIGGGDAKLIAAAAVWFGPADLAGFLLATAIAGGVLTLLLLAFRALPVLIPVGALAWLARLQDKSLGVPYGVAIAAGAFLALPSSALWRVVVPG